MSEQLPETPPTPPPHVRRPNHWRAALAHLAWCTGCERQRKTRRTWEEDHSSYRRTCMVCGHSWIDPPGYLAS